MRSPLLLAQLGNQFIQALQRLRETGERVRVLFEEIQDFGTGAYAGIQFRIASGRVSAQLDKVLRIVVKSQRLPNFLNGRNLLRRGHARSQAAQGMPDIEGWIMAGRSQLARQNKVTVQDAANRIANRLVKIVSLHQDGKESRD